jgi:hypothetical protein
VAPSSFISTFNAPCGAANPGPKTSRPQSPPAQQNSGQRSLSRQQRSSSASNRVGLPNSCMALTLLSLGSTISNSTSSPANPPIPDPRPATDPSRTKQATQTHSAAIMARPGDEYPFRQEPSARTWTDYPSTCSRPRLPKDEMSKHPHRCSLRLQKPPSSARYGRGVHALHRPSGTPRRHQYGGPFQKSFDICFFLLFYILLASL